MPEVLTINAAIQALSIKEVSKQLADSAGAVSCGSQKQDYPLTWAVAGPLLESLSKNNHFTCDNQGVRNIRCTCVDERGYFYAFFDESVLAGIARCALAVAVSAAQR